MVGSAGVPGGATAKRIRPMFRQEVVNHQILLRWGEVIPLQPPSIRIMVWALTAAVVLVATFLAIAQYARKETVFGYLAPTASVVKVFALREGTIRTVHVEEGQRVQEGQDLLTITVDQTDADGENVDTAVLDTLTGQKTLLRNQVAAQEDRTALERDRLQAAMASTVAEIGRLEAQIGIQRERVELYASLASALRKLQANGYSTSADYIRRREAHLEQQQNLAALEQQLITSQSQLNEMRYSIEQLPAVMAERIQTLRNQLAETDQRIAEINGRRAYIIRSPVTGRVSTLQAAVGRAADPRQLQMSILPDGSKLQAELFVPSRAIGFVRPGQTVRLLYDAFPYQRFGPQTGRIVKVARTILTGTDALMSVTLKEPAYKVIVEPDRQDILAYNEKRPLQADMQLRADIILDQRSFLAWIFEPLLSIRT
jgi:membrane fusion protein